MRIIPVILLLLLTFSFAFGQNETSPIVEKEFGYKDWVYKNVQTGSDMNLRKFTVGKKLVMVVYWAPWCPNWKYDAPFVQSLYEKYKGNGFDVIGVGEYDPVDKMKASIKSFNISFTNVYESEANTEREKTVHFAQRREAGDARKWGSPWYVFLDVSKVENDGRILAKKVSVVNGELMRPEAEKFIREKLGLSAGGAVALTKSKEIEVCEPTATFKP